MQTVDKQCTYTWTYILKVSRVDFTGLLKLWTPSVRTGRTGSCSLVTGGNYLRCHPLPVLEAYDAAADLSHTYGIVNTLIAAIPATWIVEYSAFRI